MSVNISISSELFVLEEVRVVKELLIFVLDRSINHRDIVTIKWDSSSLITKIVILVNTSSKSR